MERKSYVAIQKKGKKHFLIQINYKILFMCAFLLIGIVIQLKNNSF